MKKSPKKSLSNSDFHEASLLAKNAIFFDFFRDNPVQERGYSKQRGNDFDKLGVTKFVQRGHGKGGGILDHPCTSLEHLEKMKKIAKKKFVQLGLS
jgi:hypothetical protein